MADHASTREEPAQREQRGPVALPPSALKRIALTAGVVAVNLVLLLTIGIAEPRKTADAGAGTGQAAATPRKPKPYAEVPPAGVAAPADRPKASDQAALEQWSQRVSGKTGIPAPAVSAYGRAEMWMRSKSPECGVSWSTLAAVGALASKHGTDVQGRSGWQRTVGPLRMRSAIWQQLGSRASGDGAAPKVWSVGDAALTAARYLCSQPKSMRESRGWWDAVAAYRHSVAYAQRVFSTAKQYALATR